MIQLIEGKVGSGKTYFAVRLALAHIAAGGVVYSNIEFVRRGVRQYILGKFGVRFRGDSLRSLPAMEGVKEWYRPDVIQWGTRDCPVLVILDETHLFWNARDYAQTAKTQADMLSFLSQSRKAGVDVIFISQDEGNIDRQFRVQAEQLVICRNMGKNRVPVFGVALKGWFVYETRECQNGGLLGREWHKADYGIFNAYRTEAFLDSMMTAYAATAQRVARRQMLEGFGPVHSLGMRMRLLGGLDGRIGRWLCLRSIRKRRPGFVRGLLKAST